MHAQDMAFRLERPPQLGGPSARIAGDDDGVQFGINEKLFEVGDGADDQAVPLQELHAGRRAGVEAQLMPTRRGERACHVQTVGMIAQKCKTHDRSRSIPSF